jgi:L-iditol 2-dehydrogenase
MHALIFEGPGRLRLDRVPVPRPGPGEVLIRVHSATICGTDVRIVSGRKTRDVRPGHPIGHECAGTVAAIGDGISGYALGERVAVCVVVSCGTCDYCRSDRENLCNERITLGYHTDGAFAEYMLIPAHAVARGNLFKLPDEIPIETGPLIEPMACCLNGQLEMGLNDNVRSLVIFGAGPIGLYHLLLAKAGLSSRRVTLVEPMVDRRAQARNLGAHVVCDPEEFDAVEQFDAAIVAVGVPELVNTALLAVRRNGRVNLFAGFDADTSASIDPNAIHYKQITVTGASESRRRDYAEAMELIRTGRVDVSPLVTHRFPLERFEEAFRVASDGSALKVELTMQG